MKKTTNKAPTTNAQRAASAEPRLPHWREVLRSCQQEVLGLQMAQRLF